jgi:hypothetical protein
LDDLGSQRQSAGRPAHAAGCKCLMCKPPERASKVV